MSTTTPAAATSPGPRRPSRIFICPSTPARATRDTAQNDPNASPYEKTQGSGYGYMDYAPSVYTDINVVNGNLATGGVGATPIVPYRNKNVAAKGLLKDGKTAIGECTDGLEQHDRGHRVRRP